MSGDRAARPSSCAAFGHDPACTGQGRPSCTAAECIVGIPVCPVCGQLQGVGAVCDHAAEPPDEPGEGDEPPAR